MLGKSRAQLAGVVSMPWRSAPLVMVLLVFLSSCASSAAPTPRDSASGAPALTYVAIGASDAFGIGTDDPDRQSWPTVLASLLGPHVHLINLGIPGVVVKNAISMELPIALASKPAIVTVWLAVNDFADGVPLTSYQQQLTVLLTKLRASTSAKIFVGNIPDLSLLPHFADVDPVTLAAQVAAWNVAIAGVCQRVGVSLVDIYSAWQTLAEHPEDISSDGFHPSAAGARQLAQFFASDIKHTNGIPASPATGAPSSTT